MLLVGQEQVPQPLALRAFAHVHEDLRVRDTRSDLAVECLQHLEFDRVVVLVEEALDALTKLKDAVRRREVHSRGRYRGSMPSARRQVMVDAPVETVWELIGDVSRHPEWWPRVEDVECNLLEEGCTYRQVTRRPGKTIETTISVEK